MLAWGAAAFGAVYPWGYLPLLCAAAILGGSGVIAGSGRVSRTLLIALAFVALAVLLQLIPLSAETIAYISPHSLTIQRERDLSAAVGMQHAFTLSIDSRRTWLALAFFGSFALLAAGSARMLSRDSARSLAVGVACLSVVLAIGGIVQRATFNGRVYGVWTLVQGGHPFGPFINRNHFAGWMLLVLPLTVGLLASMVSRSMSGVAADLRSRVLWFASTAANQVVLTGFGVAAMTLALTLTLSRSGIASIAVAMMLASWSMMRRQGSSVRRYVTPAFMLIAAAIAAAAVGVDRIASRFAAAGAIDMDGRRAIWLDASRMLDDFWLTGSGLNTFGIAALFYQTGLKGSHMQEAHNDYLQLATEGGLLAGVPMVIGMVVAILAIRRRLREDVGSIWWIRMGAASGLLAVGTQSLVEFSLQIPANAALFAVVLGIALHDGGGAATRRAPAAADANAAPQRPKDRVLQLANGESLAFPIVSEAARSTASRRELDLSRLDDDDGARRPPRVVHTPSRPRTNRHATTRDGPRLLLVAGLAAILLALLLISLLRG